MMANTALHNLLKILQTLQMRQIFLIYPNPVKNSLNIDSKEMIENIQIFNYLGSLVFEQKCNNSSVKLNTSDFIKGMYLVRINSINGTSTKRLVIQ